MESDDARPKRGRVVVRVPEFRVDPKRQLFPACGGVYLRRDARLSADWPPRHLLRGRDRDGLPRPEVRPPRDPGVRHRRSLLATRPVARRGGGSRRPSRARYRPPPRRTPLQRPGDGRLVREQLPSVRRPRHEPLWRTTASARLEHGPPRRDRPLPRQMGQRVGVRQDVGPCVVVLATCTATGRDGDVAVAATRRGFARLRRLLCRVQLASRDQGKVYETPLKTPQRSKTRCAERKGWNEARRRARESSEVEDVVSNVSPIGERLG